MRMCYIKFYSAGNIYFDHWGNGSTSKTRTFTLTGDTTFDAYYYSEPMVPRTGILVSLYMNPYSAGSAYWQQVINQKLLHPSVPIVAIFNPSSGPGSSRDSNIATWVGKLQNAGVQAIGYTADNYGTRPISSLKADADKYRIWYKADGLFIDEFTRSHLINSQTRR